VSRSVTTHIQTGTEAMSENLALNLIDSARRGAELPAVRLDDAVLSYGALADLTAHVAGLLRERGIQPGDRVGVMLPNVPQFAIAYYGVLRAGAIVVPMNVLLKRREVAFYLSDPGARVVFAWHEFEDEARAGADEAGAECIVVRPGEFEQLLATAPPVWETAGKVGSDTAVILYTSGTTGRPKGAELTHANLRRNVEVMTQIFSIGPEDVILGALPLFHAFGQTCALNAAIGAGGCLSLIPRFDADRALEIIERDRVNVFEGVPTMYSALLARSDAAECDVSSLRLCVSGGAALPVEVLRAFERTFDCVVLEGYGLSETSPVASFNHPDRERKPGSIGTPIDGVEMKVVDEVGDEVPAGDVGEIVIRGHNVMKSYWQGPDATADAISADGWFRTGDLGRIDEDGYFFIVDRKKELIIRGGYNVYPREIEEVLYEHPAVHEAVVIGIPHASLGEEVGAAVALKPGAEATPQELRDYVKSQVAAYKYPRCVWLVDALPKGATGKILKREVTPPPELLDTAAPAEGRA
jgi:long-chain acyl-CoA synthetase